MSKIEQLTCPACGAHEVKQLSGVNYQCDYCHSTFIVKADNPFSKFNFDSGALNTDTIETINQMKMTAVKPVKLFVVIMVAIALVGVGIASFVITTVGKATKGATSFLGEWQKPSVDNYNCLAGNKGAVVWLILKTQTNKLDSVKYILRLVDPVTKKIISEQALGEPKAWKELFNQSKLFDNDFYVSNDTAYNISDEGGIQGFDLYTGKRLFGNEFFEKKFPDLKDGITKTDKEYYNKSVKITSAAGDDFVYCFDTKQLLTEKEERKTRSENRDFSEDVYLSRNKKSKLYLCNMKRRSKDDFYIDDDYIKSFNPKDNFYKSYIKDIKPLGDAVYAKAHPISSYDNKLLFFYASDFSKHADGVLALVDKEGKLTWENKDAAFTKLVKDNTSDNIYLKYNLSNDMIVMNINGSNNQSVGVNLKTGKTVFVYDQSYNID